MTAIALIFAALGVIALWIAAWRALGTDRDHLRRTGAARVPGAYDRAQLDLLPRLEPFADRRVRGPARGKGPRTPDVDPVFSGEDEVVARFCRKLAAHPNPAKALRDLRDSLDADVLREDYPREIVDAEIRLAGGDPEAIGRRGRERVAQMLAARRAR